MDLKFAYLVGIFLLSIVWLYLFYRRKDLRKHQLIVSILSAPLAPISQAIWFHSDYWRPQYIFEFISGSTPLGLEEALFSFFVGGIGSVIYETFFHKNYRAGNGKHRHILTFTILGSALLLFLLLKGFNINTVWASIIALITMSGTIIYFDKLLKKDVIFSGLLMLLVGVFVYLIWLQIFPDIVELFWVQEGLSGINFLGIPIEELVWFFAWGTFSGVIYEFWMNKDPYPIKN